MPRAPKQCGRHDCATQATAGRTYCAAHEAERQRILAANRGTPEQRGYTHRHRATRAEWAPHVEAGEVDCWRCGEPIRPGEPWDLGHDDHDRTITRGPEHRRCNRSTAGQRSRYPTG